ncbi:MAG: recombinase family protein [Planctomycetia bacterium]|nr:recombinase family protein [Planctomycetia bacterium]
MTRQIAVYVRVSSKQQDQRSQEPDLKRWAESQEGEVVWYRDKFTGKTMQRPGMDKLLADLKAGKVSTIVVWRLDRLGRTAKGLTALFEELRELNVNLVSLRDGVDLSTPAGRLMANVLASVAAYETEVRAERVLAGQAAARAAGKKWGGSKKGRRLKVTDEQVTVIKKLHQERHPISAIARATGLSRPTVYAVLEDRSRDNASA